MPHRHLIKRVKGFSYPTQVIALDCDGSRATEHHDPLRERETLTGWYGIGTAGAAGVYRKAKEIRGTDLDTLWQSLAMRCRRGGIVWVFSEHASRMWSLLNLWEKIEDGEIRIVGSETRQLFGANVPSVPKESGGSDRSRDNAVRGGSELSAVRVDTHGQEVSDSPAPGSDSKKGKGGACILEDPPVIIDIRIGRTPGRLRIVDTANYGCTPSDADSTAEQRAQRAFAFALGMIATLKTENLGSLKSTSASQAANSWKFAHLTHPVLVHDNQIATKLEEECYYGGRCEAFRIGHTAGRIYHLDVSSMYPSICSECTLPSVLVGAAVNPSFEGVYRLLRKYSVLAHVSLDTVDNFYPYRDKRRNITVWPIGRFSTWLAGPELQLALDDERVASFHEVAWYESSPFLAAFARHILDLRQRCRWNDDLYRWCKSLGVSIVGKLGQRSRAWVDDSVAVFHRAWDSFYTAGHGGEVTRWRAVAGCTQREISSGFGFDAVPAAAGWVTSLGRVKLLTLIRSVPTAELIYCDTDSLFVTRHGFERLEESGKIGTGQPGTLRIVNVWDGVTIHGIKDYEGGGEHVQAGRPKYGVQDTAPEGLVWQSMRLKSACNSRLRPEAERVAVPFSPRQQYEHGTVLSDGRVVPLEM